MKRLLLLTFVITTGLSINCFAGNNSAAEAFATGFANSLNRSMGGNPNDSRPQPTPQVEVTTYQPVQRSEIRAIRDDGSFGPVFMNYSGCRAFVKRTLGFSDCSIVTGVY